MSAVEAMHGTIEATHIIELPVGGQMRVSRPQLYLPGILPNLPAVVFLKR
jgi:hypothetical protein